MNSRNDDRLGKVNASGPLICSAWRQSAALYRQRMLKPQPQQPWRFVIRVYGGAMREASYNNRLMGLGS